MSETATSVAPRREFLKKTAVVAAASALAGVSVPRVFAAEDNTIQMAIIGSGNRGSGAVGDALSCGGGPVKLVAMADIFPNRLEGSHKALTKQFGDRIDVPPERQFLGFDAYRKAIDCLRPGDVALLTTHAAFRMVHLEYAIGKGIHVFMEKDFAPDPGGVQRMLRLGEAADKKNLKVACGLMCRHSASRQALIQKIRDGSMGDIQFIRAYRMEGPAWMGPWKPGAEKSELLWQLRRAYKFLWASAGYFSEMMIHQVDECCWIKDSWPVSAHGVGGRMVNCTDSGQDLDTYSIEYTFADGAKAFVAGRYAPNCYNDFATYLHGTKCAAQFSGSIHAPTTHIYKDQRTVAQAAGDFCWRPDKEKQSPYHAEWAALLGRDPQRSAAQRDPPGGDVEPRLADGAGRRPHATDRHLGRNDGLEVPVLPERRGTDGRQPGPRASRRPGPLPVPVPGAWTEI